MQADGIRIKTRCCATRVAGTLYSSFTIATGPKESKGAVADGLPHDEHCMVVASGNLWLGVFNRGEPDGEGVYS